MASNSKQSSQDLAKQAAETLRNPNASAIAKSLAGSVLSQTSSKNQTGSEMETKASQVLQSDKYSDSTKALAGSVLSQSNKDR